MKKSKETMITNRELDKYREANLFCGDFRKKINNRLFYIVDVIKKVYASEFVKDVIDDYNFDMITSAQAKEFIVINLMDRGHYYRQCEDKIIDKFGNEIYIRRIPIRWFFEDFEEELINGEKLYLEKHPERNRKEIAIKLNAIDAQITDLVNNREALKKLL